MMSGSQHRTMEQLGGTQAQEVNSLKIFFLNICNHATFLVK